MRAEPHRLAPETFIALATGGGGAAAVGDLVAAQRSKQLMLVRALADLAEEAGPVRAAAVRAAYASLSEIQRDAPESVAAVLFYPAVRAWTLRTVQALRQGRADADPERLAAVAAAAAVRAALRVTAPQGALAPGPGAAPEPVRVGGPGPGPDPGFAPGIAVEIPDPGPALSLPSLGVARIPGDDAPPPGRATVRAYPGGAEITAGAHRVAVPADPHTDGPGWQGVRRLSAEVAGRRIELLLDDLDPYRFPDSTTPDGTAGHDAAEWQCRLTAGWGLLVRLHPQVAAEVAAGLTVITPLAARDGAQLSGTARETFGCAAMSLPPNARSVAVTLAHEIQHAKLAALMDLFELTRAPAGERYYAPWRPDPRPFTGLLHGAYAHTGVADFWNRQRYHEDDAAAELHAHTEFAVWRDASHEVAGFLAGSGLLTETGRRFVAGMLTTLERLRQAPVPQRALALARERLEQHRHDWARPG